MREQLFETQTKGLTPRDITILAVIVVMAQCFGVVVSPVNLSCSNLVVFLDAAPTSHSVSPGTLHS